MKENTKCDDGEIIGLDTDGCFIQWSDDEQHSYNCGETPEQFGCHNMTNVEEKRIARARADSR